MVNLAKITISREEEIKVNNLTRLARNKKITLVAKATRSKIKTRRQKVLPLISSRLRKREVNRLSMMMEVVHLLPLVVVKSLTYTKRSHKLLQELLAHNSKHSSMFRKTKARKISQAVVANRTINLSNTSRRTKIKADSRMQDRLRKEHHSTSRKRNRGTTTITRTNKISRRSKVQIKRKETSKLCSSRKE